MTIPVVLKKTGNILEKTGAVLARLALLAGRVLVSVLIVAFFTAIICAGVFGLYVKNELLPKATLDVGNINMNYTSIIYYTSPETGEKVELTSLYGSENRVWVNYSEIPKNLADAFIAIEDERFESHKGVDWKRTLGAVLNLMMPFSSNFGGSTITQQLVKNLTDDTDITIQRKMLEILRALNLERDMSKEQILELYLNTINLSQGCYGVRAAANVYFGKEPKDLTLAECASIAAITNSPTYYDPFQNRENNKERQELILDKMLKLGMISPQEYSEAVAQKLVFNTSQENENQETSVQSYFVDYLISKIIADLQANYGYSQTLAYKMVYSGGLNIEATIDPQVQSAMEFIYSDRSNFPTTKGTTQPESAMVIMSPDGRLLGLVGGIGEKYGSLVLNRALSKRSPGSAIKPITVYAPALEYDLITPYSVFDDTPAKLISNTGVIVTPEAAAAGEMSVSSWPVNSNRINAGLVTATRAVANSLNTIAVRVLDLVGLRASFDFATKNFGLGLVESLQVNNVTYTDIGYSALALGGLSRGISPLELTAAYVPFTNDGIYYEPTPYTRVLDSEGNVLLDKTGDYHQAVSPETAYYMRYMLEQTVTSGTGTAAKISGIATAGKTGTTSNDHDRWFVGFTPYYVGAVWFGYDTQREITGVSGNPSLQTWKKVMDILHEGKEKASFKTPEGLSTYAYCMDSGCIPTALCHRDMRGDHVAYGKFFEGDQPTTKCTLHVSVDVCTESGCIANEYCPYDARRSEVRLNLYRYFYTPGITVGDEGYTVHFPGTLPDSILAGYFPAVARTGEALEKTCPIHTAPATTPPPETTTPWEPPETTTTTAPPQTTTSTTWGWTADWPWFTRR